jgi:hypothetical protein
MSDKNGALTRSERLEYRYFKKGYMRDLKAETKAAYDKRTPAENKARGERINLNMRKQRLDDEDREAAGLPKKIYPNSIMKAFLKSQKDKKAKEGRNDVDLLPTR